ncbi:MAG: hypothetical protein M4579_001543 [Chaenotheca gracillima]|nr:MAG: hypothetical protein M4579_001543 [Chaenotheca gracillima]
MALTETLGASIKPAPPPPDRQPDFHLSQPSAIAAQPSPRRWGQQKPARFQRPGLESARCAAESYDRQGLPLDQLIFREAYATLGPLDCRPRWPDG